MENMAFSIQQIKLRIYIYTYFSYFAKILLLFVYILISSVILDCMINWSDSFACKYITWLHDKFFSCLSVQHMIEVIIIYLLLFYTSLLTLPFWFGLCSYFVFLILDTGIADKYLFYATVFLLLANTAMHIFMACLSILKHNKGTSRGKRFVPCQLNIDMAEAE